MARAAAPLALLAALVAPTAGLTVSGGASSVAAAASGAAARSAEWQRCLQAEAEEQSFWSKEWTALESELVQLQSVANASAAPAKTIQAPEPKKHSKSPLAGLKLNLEPKSPADLVPALAMLKGLYKDGKERIGKLNAKEKEAKKKFEEKQALHDQRLQVIEARFKNGTLSADFRTNETRDEDRLWNYWEKVRERQHKQFHTSLKIQHGTLEKVKQMIDMYEKTIAGKADKAQVAKQLARVSGGVPEVVFLQAASHELSTFCREALVEVRSQRRALSAHGQA